MSMALRRLPLRTVAAVVTCIALVGMSADALARVVTEQSGGLLAQIFDEGLVERAYPKMAVGASGGLSRATCCASNRSSPGPWSPPPASSPCSPPRPV